MTQKINRKNKSNCEIPQIRATSKLEANADDKSELRSEQEKKTHIAMKRYLIYDQCTADYRLNLL